MNRLRRPISVIRVELDARMAALTGLTCRGAGCSHCCSGPIPVQAEELVDLLPRVTRTQRNAARQVDLETQYRCPLLDVAGRCTVYDVRPLICRGFVSTADPIGCSPSSRLSPRPHPGARLALDLACVASGADPKHPLYLAEVIAGLPDMQLVAG